MSDKLQGGVLAGSTSVSIPVILRKTTDNTENTGTVAAGVTAYYWRQGGTPTALTAASDLAAITSAFSAGGWKAADGTNAPGVYRLDVDNAAFATGADWVVITVKVASCYLFTQMFSLTTNVVQTGDTFARLGAPAGASTAADIAAVKTDTAAIKTKTDFLPSATAGATGGVFIAGTNAATTVTTSFTTTFTGNLTGSVGSVTGLTASNLDAAISSRMATFTLPTNFSSLAITGGGAVTAGTVSDKTGYALSGTQTFNNTGTWTGNIVGTLSTLTTYTGNTPQTGDVFATANAEPTSVPASNASLADKLAWMFALNRNKITQTATQMLLRNNADGATIGTSATSDDGTTAIRDKFT